MEFQCRILQSVFVALLAIGSLVLAKRGQSHGHSDTFRESPYHHLRGSSRSMFHGEDSNSGDHSSGSSSGYAQGPKQTQNLVNRGVVHHIQNIKTLENDNISHNTNTLTSETNHNDGSRRDSALEASGESGSGKPGGSVTQQQIPASYHGTSLSGLNPCRSSISKRIGVTENALPKSLPDQRVLVTPNLPPEILEVARNAENRKKRRKRRRRRRKKLLKANAKAVPIPKLMLTPELPEEIVKVAEAAEREKERKKEMDKEKKKEEEQAKLIEEQKKKEAELKAQNEDTTASTRPNDLLEPEPDVSNIVSATEEEIKIQKEKEAALEAHMQKVDKQTAAHHSPKKKPKAKQSEAATTSQTEASSVEQETSSIQHEAPSIQQEVSSTEPESPVVQHETQSKEHETSSIQHKKPPIQHKRPSIQHETSPVQNDPPSIQHEAPPMQHKAQSIQHETSSVQNETPLLPHETPLVQEEMPSIQHAANVAQQDKALAQQEINKIVQALEVLKGNGNLKLPEASHASSTVQSGLDNGARIPLSVGPIYPGISPSQQQEIVQSVTAPSVSENMEPPANGNMLLPAVTTNQEGAMIPEHFQGQATKDDSSTLKKPEPPPDGPNPYEVMTSDQLFPDNWALSKRAEAHVSTKKHKMRKIAHKERSNKRSHSHKKVEIVPVDPIGYDGTAWPAPAGQNQIPDPSLNPPALASANVAPSPSSASDPSSPSASDPSSPSTSDPSSPSASDPSPPFASEEKMGKEGGLDYPWLHIPVPPPVPTSEPYPPPPPPPPKSGPNPYETLTSGQWLQATSAPPEQAAQQPQDKSPPSAIMDYKAGGPEKQEHYWMQIPTVPTIAPSQPFAASPPLPPAHGPNPYEILVSEQMCGSKCVYGGQGRTAVDKSTSGKRTLPRKNKGVKIKKKGRKKKFSTKNISKTKKSKKKISKKSRSKNKNSKKSYTSKRGEGEDGKVDEADWKGMPPKVLGGVALAPPVPGTGTEGKEDYPWLNMPDAVEKPPPPGTGQNPYEILISQQIQPLANKKDGSFLYRDTIDTKNSSHASALPQDSHSDELTNHELLQNTNASTLKASNSINSQVSTESEHQMDNDNSNHLTHEIHANTTNSGPAPLKESNVVQNQTLNRSEGLNLTTTGNEFSPKTTGINKVPIVEVDPAPVHNASNNTVPNNTVPNNTVPNNTAHVSNLSQPAVPFTRNNDHKHTENGHKSAYNPYEILTSEQFNTKRNQDKGNSAKRDRDYMVDFSSYIPFKRHLRRRYKVLKGKPDSSSRQLISPNTNNIWTRIQKKPSLASEAESAAKADGIDAGPPEWTNKLAKLKDPPSDKAEGDCDYPWLQLPKAEPLEEGEKAPPMKQGVNPYEILTSEQVQGLKLGMGCKESKESVKQKKTFLSRRSNLGQSDKPIVRSHRLIGSPRLLQQINKIKSLLKKSLHYSKPHNMSAYFFQDRKSLRRPQNYEEEGSLTPRFKMADPEEKTVFLVDTSSSVARKHLKEIRSFLTAYVKNDTKNGSMIALVTYGENPRIVQDFASKQPKEATLEAISKMRASQGRPDLEKAIEYAVKELTLTSTKDYLYATIKMVMLIAEPIRKDEQDKLDRLVSKMVHLGIKRYVVGLGKHFNENKDALELLSSYPVGSYVITANYTTLPKMAHLMRAIIKGHERRTTFDPVTDVSINGNLNAAKRGTFAFRLKSGIRGLFGA